MNLTPVGAYVLAAILAGCGGGSATPAAPQGAASSAPAAPPAWWTSEPYIRAAVALYEPRTEACWREALSRDARFDSARMLVAIVVRPSGDVAEVRVRESSHPDAAFDACMAHAYRGLHFPPGPSAGVRLELPVRFSRRRVAP